ncbi:MAG: flagellar biosynthetic protein FliR [bacterium]|nr:flagellar biosynthetic protein FliR [bacterium]
MDFFLNNFQVLVLVFARISGLFIIAPFFSSNLIPPQVKITLSALLTLILYPILTKFHPAVPGHLITYGLMIMTQLGIGLILGFIVNIIFTAFQLGAQYYSFQMGFGINEVYDPLSEIEIPVIGQYQYLIAILVFLSLQGHHLLLSALYQSFEIIPLVDFTKPSTMQFFSNSLVKIFTEMFVLSLKISFPLLATMFLVSLVLGLLAKASPQMNIFNMGFPVQIGIGLAAITVIIPFMIEFMGDVMHFLFNDIIRFMVSIR